MRRVLAGLLLVPLPALAAPRLLPPPVPAVAGCPVDLRVAGLGPRERVLVEASFVGPGGPSCLTSPLPGCLDLEAPLEVGRGRADAKGRLLLRRVVPATAPTTIWVQALGEHGGTSPLLRLDLLPDDVDTDGDGLPDVVECALGTDRTRTDTDGDHLSDADEDLWGTDPTDPDTDGDGLVDGLDPRPRVPGPKGGAPNAERLASQPGSPMLDPEFEPSGHRFTWQDPVTGEAWIGAVDPVTGAFVPRDGRGVRLGDGLAPMRVSANGPEWVASAAGARVVWTAAGGGTTWLVQAAETSGGWVTSALPGTLGAVQVSGTSRPDDPEPWIAYRSAGQTASRARRLDDPASDVLVPGDLQNMHWVGHVLVGTAPAPVGRVARAWNARTGVASAFDDPSGATTPDAWWVPLVERPGTTVLVAARRRPGAPRAELVVYRRTAAGFEEARAYPAPPALPWIWSPEPFVWKGRTWVVYAVNTAMDWGMPTEGQLWIASLDPDRPPVFRRVCAEAPRQRNDPEAYVAGERPWIYFTGRRQGMPAVYRCDPGL